MTSIITFGNEKKFPGINFKMQNLFANQTKSHQMVVWICFFFTIFDFEWSIHFGFYVFINRLNKWRKKEQPCSCSVAMPPRIQSNFNVECVNSWSWPTKFKFQCQHLAFLLLLLLLQALHVSWCTEPMRVCVHLSQRNAFNTLNGWVVFISSVQENCIENFVEILATCGTFYESNSHTHMLRERQRQRGWGGEREAA